MLNGEKIATRLKNFLSNRFVFVSAGFALAINIAVGWFLYDKFHQQTQFVPLHYNIYFGIDLYGPWHQILIIPATGLGFLFINLILSFILYRRARLFSYVLLISLNISELILLGSSWLIVSQLLI